MPSSSSFLFASAAAVVSAFTVSAAAAAPAVVIFDIPAGDLGAALERFAAQSRQQLLYSPSLVAGRRSPAVRGAMTADQALVQLLAGSGITVQRPRAGVVVLHGPEAGTAGSAELAVGEPEDTLVDQVVVTGSLIRGSAAPAAPVVILKRDDIDRTGAGTLAEALNALPQAFGGSATPDTFMTGGDNNNSTAATGINLRGLGADATLVLVNGRRLAGSGAKGDFADVSSIPLTAVDRVDVLLDGASALYGPDMTEEIMSNCGVEVVFAPKELQVAQALSERLGFYTFKARSQSRPSGLSSGRRSQTQSDQRRALMLPQELMQMDRGHLIVLTAGAPPVKGRKLAFYREPTFAARVTPPPAPPPPLAVLADAPRDRLDLASAAKVLAEEGLEPPPPHGASDEEVEAWVDRFLTATAPELEIDDACR